MKVLKLAALLIAVGMPQVAEAHRAWLLPSATVLSGEEAWITVDAAVSNDLFFFEHNPLKLDALTIVAPDGSEIEPQNASTGKFRSTFDVELKKPGTYRMAVASNMVFAQYKLSGEEKRWRGPLEKLEQEIPKGAADLKVTQSQRRLEAFATLGAPTEETLKVSGSGLELEPITHPNDLFANEEANFRLLIDGKPAADLEVSVVRGGIRYRDDLGETKVKTDKDGKFAVTWAEPGMYWLEASLTDDKPTIDKATERRAGYVATLEVLPQ